MKEPLEEVLITNFKIIDTSNYQKKPVFQYFPVFPHYLKDNFFKQWKLSSKYF